MQKIRKVTAPMKALSTPPLMTRGLRRQQAKALRRREQVPPGTLVIGIDLARERQAVSYGIGSEVLGRRRISCAPQDLAQVLDEGLRLAAARGAPDLVM